MAYGWCAVRRYSSATRLCAQAGAGRRTLRPHCIAAACPPPPSNPSTTCATLSCPSALTLAPSHDIPWPCDRPPSHGIYSTAHLSHCCLLHCHRSRTHLPCYQVLRRVTLLASFARKLTYSFLPGPLGPARPRAPIRPWPTAHCPACRAIINGLSPRRAPPD
eukprot:7195756-Prymnesium_polylepis.1